MQTTQQKHIISTKDQDSLLIGSGVEKTVPYLISDSFAFKAKDNGKVLKIDNTNKLVILQYDNGKKDIISLENNLSKNSGGGFFVSHNYDLLYKEEEKFSKGDIIAKNSKFFNGDKKHDINYVFGKLTKVALTSSDSTYEDSSIITENLSEAMTSFITMKKSLNLGINANISYIVKEGQSIKTGDPLIIFESSFEDSSINDILNKIGKEYSEDIQELTKNELKSKYTGKIVKINMYYNHDLSEYQPTTKKIIEDYINIGKKKKDIYNKTVGNGFASIGSPIIDQQPKNKKIGNEVLDGLFIEFFIEYEDKLGIGDKISYYSAVKSVVADVVKIGEEPYSEYREEEPIDAIFSPLSVVSRMTLDIYPAMYCNKALLELKKQIKNLIK